MIRFQFCAAATLLSVGLLVTAPPATAQLETRGSSATGTTPLSVVVADFNGDGKMDFAVASVTVNEVEVFLGNGDGTFRSVGSYNVGATAGAIAVGDLNHDGIPDLIVANFAPDSVDVLLGNGDGTFQPPLNYATPSFPAAVVVGDFNGDGNLDIATADQSDLTTTCSCVSVLLGNGDGTFQEPAIITYPPYSLPQALVAGYFNGDNKLDLAVTLGFISSDTVQILLGNGDGTFSVGGSYTIAPSSLSIAAADLRKNGKTDLAVAESGGMGVAVLLGNGDGTFEQPVVYNVSTSLAVAIGDMNGDGIPDLVALSSSSNAAPAAVAMFLGNGDGTFPSSPKLFPLGHGAFLRALALADFNGDGWLDVTVADQSGDIEYAMLNTGAAAFSPSTPLRFGKQRHGTTSKAQTVTLTNKGKTALKIHSMKATGQFGMTSTCSASLPTSASCTIGVTFSPRSAGGKLGTVEIDDSASSKPQVIALSGTGT